MTPETVEFLKELLNSFSLQANHPQFEIIAQRVVAARRELEGYNLAHVPRVEDSKGSRADPGVPSND